MSIDNTRQNVNNRYFLTIIFISYYAYNLSKTFLWVNKPYRILYIWQPILLTVYAMMSSNGNLSEFVQWNAKKISEDLKVERDILMREMNVFLTVTKFQVFKSAFI